MGKKQTSGFFSSEIVIFVFNFTETGRLYEIEMNVERTKVMRI
jgi:hypothetical protein